MGANDHNGFVTFKELKECIPKEKISEEELHEIYDAIDEEHTGLIHCNEFIAACLQEKYYMDEHYIRDAFDKLDTEHHGYITVEDLRALLGRRTTQERAQEILMEAELENHGDDHKVSYQEFLKFMRTDGEERAKAAKNYAGDKESKVSESKYVEEVDDTEMKDA